MTFHYKIKYLYHYMRAEYFFGFPLGTVDYVSKLLHQDYYRGDLVILLVACLVQLNDRTWIEMAEDLIFQDMGTFNWGQLIPYVLYFSPLVILISSLMYVENHEMWFDLWPEYDHCRSPVSLLMKN